MPQISSVKKIDINDFKGSLPMNRNFEIAISIAQIFSTTINDQDAFILEYSFDDSSKVIFPIVKIKSRLTILASLPNSWKTHFLYSSKENLAHKFNLIIRDLKAHFIHISLPDIQNCDFKEALLNSKLQSGFYNSYITPLKTRTFEEIFKNDFSSKTRNQCRKALKSGVIISTSKHPEDVKKYFDIYTETTQLWGRQYNLYPLKFFEQLVALERVDFWTAYSEDTFLGGIIIIKYDNWVYYWSGMTDRKYSSLCANNGLLYEAIQFYGLQNFDYFDYGPSEGLGNVDKFKRGFGPKEIKHYTFKYESKSYKYILKPISSLKNRLLKIAFPSHRVLKIMKKIIFIIKYFKSTISDILHIYKLQKTFPTVKFGKSLDIQNIDRVEIGSNTIISNNTTINCGADWSESKGYFKCGKNNYIGPNSVIFAAGGVTFGDNTMIGPGVNIISHQHNYDDVTKSHYEQPSKFSAINIGDNVMIYTNATVAPGVSIGDDAIIGANAFVIKDVETKTMVAGIPAKFIRKLP